VDPSAGSSTVTEAAGVVAAAAGPGALRQQALSFVGALD
jgi:hypothetical protein